RPPDPARGAGDQRAGGAVDAHAPEPMPWPVRARLSSMSEDHATEAEEEYLQSLFWLHEAGLPMTGANLARAMQLSAPTVHEMLGRLERDGYVTRDTEKAIHFTDEGRRDAEEIVSRHRLLERLLPDVEGVPWDAV